MIWHHYIFCQIQNPLFQDMKPVRLIYWFNKYQTTTLVGIIFDSVKSWFKTLNRNLYAKIGQDDFQN